MDVGIGNGIESAHSKLRSVCALLQAGMPAAPIPQPMMQPKVPSMWAQPGTYQPEADRPHFETELEINDFPQHARWKVSHTSLIPCQASVPCLGDTAHC